METKFIPESGRIKVMTLGAALSHIGEQDLTNGVLEVDLVASAITCREYLDPGAEQ